jgi:hypothetical protein
VVFRLHDQKSEKTMMPEERRRKQNPHLLGISLALGFAGIHKDNPGTLRQSQRKASPLAVLHKWYLVLSLFLEETRRMAFQWSCSSSDEASAQGKTYTLSSLFVWKSLRT